MRPNQYILQYIFVNYFTNNIDCQMTARKNQYDFTIFPSKIIAYQHLINLLYFIYSKYHQRQMSTLYFDPQINLLTHENQSIRKMLNTFLRKCSQFIESMNQINNQDDSLENQAFLNEAIQLLSVNICSAYFNSLPPLSVYQKNYKEWKQLLRNNIIDQVCKMQTWSVDSLQQSVSYQEIDQISKIYKMGDTRTNSSLQFISSQNFILQAKQEQIKQKNSHLDYGLQLISQAIKSIIKEGGTNEFHINHIQEMIAQITKNIPNQELKQFFQEFIINIFIQENQLQSLKFINQQKCLKLKFNEEKYSEIIVKNVLGANQISQVKQEGQSLSSSSDTQLQQNNHQQSKRKIFQQILRIKKELLAGKIFKSQLQKNIQLFELYRMSQDQIKQKINAIKSEDYAAFQQQLNQIYRLVQQICLNEQQICRKHKEPIYYLKNNKKTKQNTFLCNLCIAQNKQNHPLYCKFHRKIINYKDIQAQSDDQIFVCEICLLQENIDKKQLICLSHYQQITKLCTEKQCIIFDGFKLCRHCDHQQLNHDIVQFDKDSLMNHFSITSQNNIYSVIEESFLDIRAKISLSPLIKLISSYLRQHWHLIKIFQSFLINDNRLLQKWVDCILDEPKKQEMLVLSQLKRKLKAEQIGDYMQAYISYLNIHHENLFIQLSNSILNFKQRLLLMKSLDNLKIQQILLKKYENIIDYQDSNKTIITPMRIQLIHQKNYRRIKNIYINKESESSNDQSLAKSWKNARKMFFSHHLPQYFIDYKIGCKHKSMIVDLLINQQQKHVNFEKLGEIQSYREAVSYLRNHLKFINSSYQIKIKECAPLKFILDKKLQNLQRINIRYTDTNPLYFFSDKFKYSISAFQLFELVHNNQRLEYLGIDGVQVTQMQEFMSLLRKERVKYFGKQCEQCDLKKQLQWIKIFQQNQNLRLYINTQINFIVSSSQVRQKIQELTFFMNFFRSLGQITVTIQLNQWNEIQKWVSNLVFIINSIKEIQRMRISIKGIYNNEIQESWAVLLQNQFFKHLPSMSNVFGLSFFDLRFKDGIQKAVLIGIQKYLEAFIKNNQINALELYHCKNLPVLPTISTLQSVSLWKNTFRENCCFASRIIQANKSLKMIEIYGVQAQSEEKFNLSDQKCLQILHLNTECDSIWINGLSQYSLSSLKYLNIDRLSLSDNNSILAIIKQLTNLKYLSTDGIHFQDQIILQMTSCSLQQFHIASNHLITNKGFRWMDLKMALFEQDDNSYQLFDLGDCKQINEMFLGICEFQGLIQLIIDKRIIEVDPKALQYLKRRGVITHVL